MSQTSSPPPHHPGLTPLAITEAALALAHEQGLASVSIRRLAARLGVTPMAIYWHIPNKEALLDAMAAALFVEIPGNDDATAPWQHRLRDLLGAVLMAARAHPAIAPLLATRTVSSVPGLEATERMLDILRTAGYAPTEATQIGRLAISTISNLVGGQPGFLADPQGGSAATNDAALQLDRLPADHDHDHDHDHYPRILEASAPLTAAFSQEEYFAFGLDLLIAGIVGMAPASRLAADS
ncbi:MAG: TetR/AcrR family transcriptional regulator [Thermomicrobiales bacterium]